MFKKNSQIIVNNRGISELATVMRSYRRKDVKYYDVITDRKITFEHITEDKSYPVHVDRPLSEKLVSNKLTRLENG